jgi:hypothetical protein
VFENRGLRGIFGFKIEELPELRRMHNEELNNLYSSTNTIKVIKSRMRLVGHGTRMGDMKKAQTW